MPLPPKYKPLLFEPAEAEETEEVKAPGRNRRVEKIKAAKKKKAKLARKNRRLNKVRRRGV
jgi:hypothetical protein